LKWAFLVLSKNRKGKNMTQDLARVNKAIRQYARTHGVEIDRVEEVLDQLQGIVAFAGPITQARQQCLRLGQALLQSHVKLLVPLCHVWDEVVSLGDALPPLACSHIEFLAQACAIAPQLQPFFLVADTEASDPALLESLSLARDEFLERIAREKALLERRVSSLGWSVELMSEAIPDMAHREREALEDLSGDKSAQARITDLTLGRSLLYQRMGIQRPEAQRARTVQVAAQYLALGRYAAISSGVIATHTTNNVMWYRDAQVTTVTPPLFNNFLLY
jgi:hypothetical protein